ncbi:MAG: hypothetical protein M1438_21315 [Deltaproteobacteria bacterium]|nr:hypothetical protein [Deltaproteobacteria bacterium]
MATILVLTLGASAAMACSWGGNTGGQYTAYSGPHNCSMVGSPGKYYCPRTRNGYCPMVAAPGRYTPYASTTDWSGQYYTYPATNYGGWGCW